LDNVRRKWQTDVVDALETANPLVITHLARDYDSVVMGMGVTMLGVEDKD
jgi:hypothetical protein